MRTLAPIKQLSEKDMKRMAPYLPSAEPRVKKSHLIPVCEPDLSGNEKKYLIEALQSSWISSSGDFVERFERAFARTISQTPFAFAVNSGTTALHVALASLGIGRGDEVILPAFTMVATINAITYCGATPVLVDSDPLTWNMNVTQIEAKVTTRTRAIIVVHTYGLPVDMDRVLAVAKKHKVWVVEDAAEASGAEYKTKRVGGIGDVAAFSLYANKIITTGEGGMVTTTNPEIARRIGLLRNHAFTKERHFWHTMIGFGYRMTSLQAAVGLAQAERFDEFVRKKRHIAKLYTKFLKHLSGIGLPNEPVGMKHIYWMYGIVIHRETFGMDKNKLREYLADRGIETRSFFIPIHFQPVYYEFFKKEQFPVAESLCRDGLYLPSSTKLREKDIQFIASAIAKR